MLSWSPTTKRYHGGYQIIAVPTSTSANGDDHHHHQRDDVDNQDGPLNRRWENIVDFTTFVHDRLSQTQPQLVEKVIIDQVTRLVDQGNDDDPPLGDCFLVGTLFIGSTGESTNKNDDDDDEDLLTLFGNVSNWLDPSAEVWVTCSESIPLPPPYGWKLQDFVFQLESTTTDDICLCLRNNGLAVIQTTTTPGEEESDDNNNNLTCKEIQKRFQDYVTLLEDTVKENHQHIILGQSAFGFKEYTHRGIQRFEVLFDPSSDLYTSIRTSFEHQWKCTVCQYLKVESIEKLRLNISCVYSRPGSPNQDWHTDGDHYIDQQHRRISVPTATGVHNDNADDSCHHEAYAVCIFVPLIPLTETTGYTRFWPKSHRYPNLLGLARAADGCLQATVDTVGLHPGDFVMYDYTTWHRGMANQSTTGTERPILQFLYSLSWYKERKNYGTQSVFDKYPIDEER